MSTTTRQTIEKEIHELWMPDRQGTSVTSSGLQRTYTLNLVIYAPNLDSCREAEAVLRELTPIHPGRYIMLCPATESETAPLHHHVTGHCVFNPERNKQICCDIITLEAKPSLLQDLYGLPLSLLISDLPVEFWWLSDLPLTSPLFRKIAADADRVWVDSSRFLRPQEALAVLASTWERSFPNTVLADLNWVRFQRWRRLIAELFDDEWTPYLGQIRELSIEYGAGTLPTRSFLLTCWMAARLGWRYRGEPRTEFPDHIEFASDHGPVTARIKPVAVADPQRDRLYAIRIRTAGDQQGLFTVVRDQDPQCVLASSEIDGKVAFSRILCFEHLESVQLLGEGLRGWGRDAGWEGTLAVLQTIMQGPA